MITENIIWLDCAFPNSKTSGINDLNAYENLASSMGRLNKFHDQHMFYRLEMRARRQSEERKFYKTFNWLYEIVADYGYGVGRAALWWLAHIFVGAAFLVPRDGVVFDLSSWSNIKTGIKTWSEALTVSFSNAHSFLGLRKTSLKDLIDKMKDLDLWANFEAIATAQTIFGAIFLFFLLLTARNRFRMK